MKSGLDPKTPTPASQDQGSAFLLRLREISMFFDGTDRVHQAMRKVAAMFDHRNIPYAIMGGMAVNAHRHTRTTDDVDFLIRRDSFAAVLQMASEGLLRRDPVRARKFYEVSTNVRVDVLLTGGFPGNGNPGPIAFPDPLAVSEMHEELRVIDLRTLIELKLAARRFQDFADVVNLIREHHLDASYRAQLHPSVHGDYIECLEEKRREDEYEAREGA